MITIFVGDITDDLHKTAFQFDELASIITNDNYNKLTDGTYYVSLGDLSSLEVFYKILSLADTLVYSPPNKWSDEKKSISKMKLWTEFYILFFRNKKNVIGLEHITNGNLEIKLAASRKTDMPQLWVAGCSVSHGVGVKDNQRYGQLLADKLQLPVSFLTAPGASNEWAIEQILLSDIRKEDIVILGLTTFNRFVYYTDTVVHINYAVYEHFPDMHKIFNIDILDSNFLKYKSVSHILQVANFCKKIGCKLIIAGLLIDEYDAFYVKNIPNYIQLLGTLMGPTRVIDIGSDNSHPGPLSHEWYANQIFQYLNDFS